GGMGHGLDALGHDLDAHGFADIDDGGEELALALVDQDRIDQLPVDLEPFGAKLLQRHDGGIAGAEIVDLDIDAQILDLVDIPADHGIAFVEIDRFHQFKRQPSRLDIELAQAVDEVFIIEPAQRYVDRGARHA